MLKTKWHTGFWLLVLLPALVTSCGPAKDEKVDTVTYQVNSYRVPCTGVAPMECLQVRKEGSEAWEFFYSQIEGFQFEPGYLYRIRVREEQLDPAEVPADASSIKYTLVSVEEKVPDPKLRLNDIWVLRELEGREVSEEQLGGQLKRPYIEFQLRDNRYMGTDGCNTFRGAIAGIGERELKLGPAMSTRMACPDMSLPDEFLRLLARCDSYRIGDRELSLLEGDTEVMRFQKTD